MKRPHNLFCVFLCVCVLVNVEECVQVHVFNFVITKRFFFFWLSIFVFAGRPSPAAQDVCQWWWWQSVCAALQAPCGISLDWVVFNCEMLRNHQNLPKMGIMLIKILHWSILSWSPKSLLTQAGTFIAQLYKSKGNCAIHASKAARSYLKFQCVF